MNILGKTFISRRKDEQTLSTNMYHRPICSLCYVEHTSMWSFLPLHLGQKKGNIKKHDITRPHKNSLTKVGNTISSSLWPTVDYFARRQSLMLIGLDQRQKEIIKQKWICYCPPPLIYRKSNFSVRWWGVLSPAMLLLLLRSFLLEVHYHILN